MGEVGEQVSSQGVGIFSFMAESERTLMEVWFRFQPAWSNMLLLLELKEWITQWTVTEDVMVVFSDSMLVLGKRVNRDRDHVSAIMTKT